MNWSVHLLWAASFMAKLLSNHANFMRKMSLKTKSDGSQKYDKKNYLNYIYLLLCEFGSTYDQLTHNKCDKSSE